MESHKSTTVDAWVEERLAHLQRSCDWEPDTAQGLATLRRRNSRKAWKRITFLAVVTVTASFAILVVLPPTRVLAQRCVNACLAQASAVKAALKPKPIAAPPSGELTPTQERKQAVDFTLFDAFGRPISLSNYRGLVVLLNFWATWCAPCDREIPWFNEFQREHQDAGFVVLGVSLDNGGWRIVRPFLKAHHINYPILLGNGRIARSYGAEMLPATFIIDRRGRVASIHHGLVGKQTYEREIVELLSEQ